MSCFARQVIEMEENVLKDFETFSEFPDKYLKVSKNSSYYFIKKSGENFVTKRSLDSLSTVNIFNKDTIKKRLWWIAFPFVK